MSDTPNTSVPAQPPVPAAPPRRRKWLKRIAIVASVLAGGTVVIVVSLPTLLTSSMVERRVSAIASQKLGRPVTISGLDAGWRSPLKIGKVRLEPTVDEGEYALLSLEGVEVPATLWSLLTAGGKYDLGKISIGRFETNLVMLPDGRWNAIALKDSLGTSPEEPEEPEPEAPPAPLPLQNLSFEVKEAHLRVVDPGRNMVAGIEDLWLLIDWPGKDQPLTVDVKGALRANDQRLPWDLRAKVSHWIDTQGMISATAATATISTGGMMDWEQLDHGGFFVSATAAPNQSSRVRVLLPIEDLMTFAAPLVPPGTELPKLKGALDLRAEATVSGAQEDLAAMVSFEGRDLGFEWQKKSLDELAFAVALTADASLAHRHLRSANATITLPGGGAKATLTSLPFDNPMGFGQAAVEGELEFEPLTALAARWLGAERRDGWVTGGAKGRLLATGLEDGSLGGHMIIDFAPGQLMHLEPFVAEKDLVTSLPLGLDPLALAIQANYTANPSASKASINDLVIKGPLIETVIGATADWSGPAPTWHTDITGTAPFNPLRGLLALTPAGQDIRRVGGDLLWNVYASSTEADRIYTKGAVTLRDVAVEWKETTATLALPETKASWELSAFPAEARAKLTNVSLDTGIASISAHGDAGMTLDLAGDATFDATRALQLAANFAPLPGWGAGLASATWTTKGTVGEQLSVGVQLDTPEAIEWHQPGLVDFVAPMTADTTIDMQWRGEDMALVDVAWSRATVGEAIATTGTLAVSMLPGNEDWATTATMLARPQPMLDWIAPDIWDQYAAGVGIDGETIANVMASGPLGTVEGRDIVAEGTIATNLPVIEWVMGDMAQTISDVQDNRAFHFAAPSTKPASGRFGESGSLRIGAIEGPMGVVIEGARVDTRVDADPNDAVVVELDGMGFDGLLFEHPVALLAIPAVYTHAKIEARPAVQVVRWDDVSVVGEGLGSLETEGSFNWGTFAWDVPRLEGSMAIEGIASLVAPGPEAMWQLPSLHGNIYARGAMSGGDPRTAMPANGDLPTTLPLQGSFELVAEHVGVDVPDVARVEDFNTTWTLGLSDEGRAIDGAATLAIGEVALASFPTRPMRGAGFDGSMRVTTFDRIEAHIPRATLGTWGGDGAMELSIAGLRAGLADTNANAARRWIDNLDVRSSGSWRQSFVPFDRMMPDITCRGSASIGWDVDQRAGQSMLGSMTFGAQNAGFAMGMLASVEGISGEWTARKSLRDSTGVRVPAAPEQGKFTIRRIAFAHPMARGEIVDTEVRLAGMQDRMTIAIDSRDMLGGPATATGTLHMDGGDPTIEGTFQTTGLDLGTLGSINASSGSTDEINAVGSYRWRVPRGGVGALESLTADVRSTRIGRDALARLLMAVDSNQDDPRFQSAISALSLGTVTGASFSMENAMMNAGAEVRLPAGVRVPVPILDRAPLGDVLDVYGMQDKEPLLEMARRGLTLALSEDWNSLLAEAAALMPPAPATEVAP